MHRKQQPGGTYLGFKRQGKTEESVMARLEQLERRRIAPSLGEEQDAGNPRPLSQLHSVPAGSTLAIAPSKPSTLASSSHSIDSGPLSSSSWQVTSKLERLLLLMIHANYPKSHMAMHCTQAAACRLASLQTGPSVGYCPLISAANQHSYA